MGIDDAEPIINDGNSDFYSGKKKQEYKEIIIDTIDSIKEISKRPLSNNGKIHIRLPDGQEIVKEENTMKTYFQLIDFFEDICLRYFDEQVTTEIEELNDEKKSIYNNLLNYYSSMVESERERVIVRKTRIIPNHTPLGRYCLEEFDKRLLEHYRQKFRALLLLFSRKNEFSNKRIASLSLPSTAYD